MAYRRGSWGHRPGHLGSRRRRNHKPPVPSGSTSRFAYRCRRRRSNRRRHHTPCCWDSKCDHHEDRLRRRCSSPARRSYLFQAGRAAACRRVSLDRIGQRRLGSRPHRTPHGPPDSNCRLPYRCLQRRSNSCCRTRERARSMTRWSGRSRPAHSNSAHRRQDQRDNTVEPARNAAVGQRRSHRCHSTDCPCTQPDSMAGRRQIP
jgi:hypothetical protein